MMGQVGAKLAQVGLIWGQVGAKLGPSWAKLRQTWLPIAIPEDMQRKLSEKLKSEGSCVELVNGDATSVC
eukprot:12085616-Karenia_brevis.AAC.1